MSDFVNQFNNALKNQKFTSFKHFQSVLDAFQSVHGVRYVIRSSEFTTGHNRYHKRVVYACENSFRQNSRSTGLRITRYVPIALFRSTKCTNCSSRFTVHRKASRYKVFAEDAKQHTEIWWCIGASRWVFSVYFWRWDSRPQCLFLYMLVLIIIPFALLPYFEGMWRGKVYDR